MGATKYVTPTENFTYRRRGEAELRTKFFCLLFFQKKTGGSDRICHSHRNSYLRAPKQSKALHKVLLPAFLSKKQVGAAGYVTPTGTLTYGRRSKAKLCTKFFCLLFFQKNRWERPDMSLPPELLLTGVEGKRSFP